MDQANCTIIWNVFASRAARRDKNPPGGVMATTTGTRYVAEALRAYGVTHVFFVPQQLLSALTAMEGMGIRRVMTHGEKAAA